MAFLHQRHLGFPDKNTTDFVNKIPVRQGAHVFLIPIFFLGGWIYRWRVLKKIQKDIIHPSIYAGEKDASTLHSFNPLGSQETEGRPSEHQKLMLTILTGFWFFSAGKNTATTTTTTKREGKKNSMATGSQMCVFDMLPILFYRCFLYLLMCMVLICFEYQSI